MKKGKNLNIWLAMSILLLVMACTATGKIIYVDANGGNNGSRANFQPDIQYPSIQAAIDASIDGDTVILAPGTFRVDGNRDLDFKGKAITLRSTDPNDPNIVAATIIDCNGTRSEPHRGFYFHSGEDANSVLSGFTITNGYAHYGGGIYCSGSSPTITNCTFSGNSAYKGAGILCEGGSSTTLTNCTFSSNSADEAGGGVYNRYYSSPTLNNCTFSGNFAGAGGGMYNYESNPTLTNCVFSGNSAGNRGGGVYNRNYSSPTLTNCTFIGNSASADGGGIYNYYESSPTLTNCTFSGNSAGQHGGGIWCQYGGGWPPLRSGPPLGGALIIINSILWGDTPEEIYVSDGTTVVTYCDVEGGWPGEGNIDADPCFVNAGYWDANGTPGDVNDDFWIDGNYHLKSQAGRWEPSSQSWVQDDLTSPCIDAGNPSSPIGYEPFPNGGRINMGAYGGTAEASKSYFGEPLCETIVAGDINGDCKVNFLDFRIMALHWLEDNIPLSQVPEFYYYSSNRRIYLELYTARIAVYFEDTVSREQKEALIESDPALEEIIAELARYGLVLVGTKDGSSDMDIIQAVDRLEKLAEVRYSTPVFGNPVMQMILTDEFIAKFKTDVTEEEIEAFNALHNVEIVRKLLYSDTYVLRVKDPTNMNTLRTANLYYENPITIYSVPNFIGIGEPP